MRCPKCGKEGTWYLYERTPDYVSLEKLSGGERVELGEEERKQFEEEFKKEIEMFSYGTGEVAVWIHECGFACEGEI